MFEEPNFPTPCTGRWAGRSDELSHRLSVKMRTAHGHSRSLPANRPWRGCGPECDRNSACWTKVEKHLDASEYKTLLIYSTFGTLPRFPDENFALRPGKGSSVTCARKAKPCLYSELHSFYRTTVKGAQPWLSLKQIRYSDLGKIWWSLISF